MYCVGKNHAGVVLHFVGALLDVWYMLEAWPYQYYYFNLLFSILPIMGEAAAIGLQVIFQRNSARDRR